MEERPLECGLCKRKADIIYKEIKNGCCTSYRMCSMCPKLQEKIGLPSDSPSFIEPPETTPCPCCGTSLQDLRTGGFLGCTKCYEHFGPILTKELIDTHSIPIKEDSLIAKEPSIPLHLGKGPNMSQKLDASKTLKSLHSALAEAVTFEHYERAAHLRDQIKLLTEKLYGEERNVS